MAIFPSTSIPSAAAGGDIYGYDIPNSCRFDGQDQNLLARVPSTTGNQRTYTISFWWKFGGANSNSGTASLVNYGGTQNHILTSWHTSGTGGSRYFMVFFNSSNQLKMFSGDAGTLTDPTTYSINLSTERVLRDASAWYHILVVVDTPQVTNTNRVKFYINGVQETAFAGTPVWPAQNAIHFINHTNTTMQVGGINASGWSPNASYSASGYIAEYHQIDGTALTPTSFGETDEDWKVWKPKEVTGLTYGTNGFYLDFKSSGSLGNDAAGSNNLTPANLAASDQMHDSPTNNFCIPNPIRINRPSIYFMEGSLDFTMPAGDGTGAVTTTFGVKTGKWYFECTVRATSGSGNWSSVFGIHDTQDKEAEMNYWKGNLVGYSANNGQSVIVTNNSATWANWGNTWAKNVDIMGCAFDMDAKKVWFSKNGIWQASGNPATGANPLAIPTTLTEATPFFGNAMGGSTMRWNVNFGADGTWNGTKTAQGNQDDNDYGDFYYDVPAGFLALCTKNLPTPAVKPKENFNPVVWTGNGTGTTRAITGVGFSPDMVWQKNRDQTEAHRLYDRIRTTTGGYGALFPDTTYTDAQYNNWGIVESFDADGVTFKDGAAGGTSNVNTIKYVTWNWKGGGTTLGTGAFTQGSIASTCNRNVDAGFSIVSYTGTGSNGTVGHGLSSKPELVIVKQRNGGGDENWFVGSIQSTASMDFTDYVMLNSTNGVADEITIWADTAPTASVFSVSTNSHVNESSGTYIAYCWHSVVGYSKIGAYTGNNSADGSFIYTGFAPAFVITKRINSSSSADWYMQDWARDVTNDDSDPTVLANSNAAETPYPISDLLSNGFKMRNTYVSHNQNNPYLYMAFAEHPFKYANAR